MPDSRLLAKSKIGIFLNQIVSILVVSVFATACSTERLNQIDQEIEEQYQKICEFDNITFEKVERGSPGHQLCVELWRSGIDPDEIYNNNGGGQSD